MNPSNPNSVNSLEHQSRLARVGHSLGDLALRFTVNTMIGLGTLGAAEAVTDIPPDVSRGYMAALGAYAAVAHYKNRHN